MQSRILKLSLILFLSLSSAPTAQANIDLSDNLSPTLISISLANKSLYPGQKTLLTLVIRDDKNELINLPVNIQWRPPSDAPGYIASNTDRYLSDFKVLEILKAQGSIQTTMTYVLTAPEWIGNFQGSALQGIYDSTRNESSFWDLEKTCDKPVNGILGSGSDGRRPLAFPNIKMNCDFNFSVRATTPAEKEALKEAADKAAADKAAADKAAADKAMEEQSKIDSRITSAQSTYTRLYSEINSLIRKYPSRKSELNLYLNKIFPFEVINETNIATAELNLAGIASKIISISSTYKKIARTLNCSKGNKTVKVTDVKPACPAGYKVKK